MAGTPPTTTTGVFCWHELNVPDPPRALSFYGALLGWAATEQRMGDHTYRTLIQGGCGFGGMWDTGGPEWKGVPAHWMGYISVEDVDASARRAVALGGRICVPAMDLPATGRFTVIDDPTGATVSLFRAEDASWGAEKGVVAWNELLTRDPAAAVAFYRALLGWEAEEMRMPSGAYTLLRNGGVPAAGVMGWEGPTFEGARPQWSFYVAVDDVDETIAKAETLGAVTRVPATDIPNIGRFAILTDPLGVNTAVYEAA